MVVWKGEEEKEERKKKGGGGGKGKVGAPVVWCGCRRVAAKRLWLRIFARGVEIG